MQTVLITGGTGLVGRALCTVLIRKGYKVIVLSRNALPAGSYPIQFAKWNIDKQEIDIHAVQQADYVIHLAGAGVMDKRWTKSYKKEIIDSRIKSSRFLVDTLKNNSNKVKAVISASAIGWYGADEKPVKPFEESAPAKKDFLGNTCKLWEESIEPVTPLGIRLTKLRLGIVLSNDGGALTEFKKPIRFGIAAILGNGKQIISWVHIDDLCNLFIYAMENENISGSYNAVAPKPVSNKALTLCLANALRRNFFIPIHIPAFILKLLEGDRSIEILKSTTVSCKKIEDSGFIFQYKTIESAISNLIKSSSK